MPGVPFLHEAAIGTVDGVNEIFETSTDYLAGSLRWFDNGFVQVTDTGANLTELGGKQFRLTPAPAAGTAVVVAYRPI